MGIIEITETEVNAGAKALRERQMEGRITRAWETVPLREQRKWREHARAVLEAALAARVSALQSKFDGEGVKC